MVDEKFLEALQVGVSSKKEVPDQPVDLVNSQMYQNLADLTKMVSDLTSLVAKLQQEYSTQICQLQEQVCQLERCMADLPERFGYH